MMSELAREFFSDNPAIMGPIGSILLFALVFAVAAVRAVTASRSHVERMAQLALEGDRDHE